MPLSPDIRTALVEAARAAARAEIMPRFRRLSEADIARKSSAQDLVTDADTGAETHIRATVAKLLPDARIVGEEGVAANPSELEGLGLPGLTVVIDPVDGNWNFARGLALFGTLLAVIEDGETIFGLLYDPVMDDWIEASLGEGAYHVSGHERRRLTLGPTPPLAELNGLHSAYGLSSDQWLRAAALQPRFGRVTSLRASIWDYRSLITGAVQFCVNRYLNVWDHAAGALALQEAGGHVALLDGRKYTPGLRNGYLLAAASEDLWGEIADLYRPALLPPL
ncbi:MAG: inositol monophosphatase [Pseudomonadota bacterium]